jgi:hypothetical protein
MKKLTPVLYVDAIEPVLPFWERLGFGTAISVPEGDRIGFQILVRDAVEVMYQTRDNLAHDIPSFDGQAFGPAVLYIEVASAAELDDVDARLGTAPRVMPRRKAGYGADEIWARDPAGHVIAFAFHPAS